MSEHPPTERAGDADDVATLVRAALDEHVPWEVATLSLTVGDMVTIARWLAPVMLAARRPAPEVAALIERLRTASRVAGIHRSATLFTEAADALAARPAAVPDRDENLRAAIRAVLDATEWYCDDDHDWQGRDRLVQRLRAVLGDVAVAT